MSPLIACLSYDPEVVLGVLVAILGLNHVPGDLRFACARQVSLIVLPRVARAVPRPLRPPSHVLIHSVPFGDARRERSRERHHCSQARAWPCDVRGWALALSGMAGLAPRMTRLLNMGSTRPTLKGFDLAAAAQQHRAPATN
jgi:hypothetical protein